MTSVQPTKRAVDIICQLKTDFSFLKLEKCPWWDSSLNVLRKSLNQQERILYLQLFILAWHKATSAEHRARKVCKISLLATAPRPGVRSPVNIVIFIRETINKISNINLKFMENRFTLLNLYYKSFYLNCLIFKSKTRKLAAWKDEDVCQMSHRLSRQNVVNVACN